MGVIPKEKDDAPKAISKNKEEFTVKHAPDIEQPKAKEAKEEEVGPVP